MEKNFCTYNKVGFGLKQGPCHCENLQSVSVQIRGNPKVNLRFNLWIATLALWLARNDGQRKRTLLFYNDGGLCHFEQSALAQSEKPPLSF